MPVIRSTASVSPDAGERARAFDQYAGQLRGSVDHFSLAPQVFGRAGAVAVAALLLVPLTALASRRRWAAYVVGGSLAIFAITLVPWLFTPFSDVVSLSQARRLAGFFPFGFAFAGGIGVLASLLGPLVAPVALGAGIVLQWRYPGDFGYTLEHGGPAWATWVAVGGATVALVLGLRRLRSVEATAALASALLLLPTFVHGLSEWSPSAERRAEPADAWSRRRAQNDRVARTDRLFGSRVELSNRGGRPGLHLQRPTWPCGRHRAEPPVCASRPVEALQPNR